MPKAMNRRDLHPIAFFNDWFAEPFDVRDYSVAGIVDALNRHLSLLINPPRLRHATATLPRKAGRYRIYGENQDVFYCFVYEGDESKTDPPVYFESCLDLNIDYGIKQSDIIDGDHVLVADRFTTSLASARHHICLRMESGGLFSCDGIVFKDNLELDAFVNGSAGTSWRYTCFLSDGAICIPDWGAAFLTARSRASFMTRSPRVSREWDNPANRHSRIAADPATPPQHAVRTGRFVSWMQRLPTLFKIQ